MSSRAGTTRQKSDGPHISVIVPVYNVEDYISPAIEALCRQSLHDFEVILVDDGSMDGSMTIATSMLQRHEVAFRVVRQPNSGLAAARNAGLLAAAGDLVVFVDADDVVHMDFLQVLSSAAAWSSAEATFGWYQMVTPSQSSRFPLQRRVVESLDSAVVRGRFLTRETPLIAPGVLCSRRLLLEKELTFNPDMRFSEDQEWLWRLLLAIESITFVDTVLYNYVRRPRSIMTSSTSASIESGFQGVIKLTEGDSFRNAGAPALGRKVLARWVVATAHSSALILDEDAYRSLLQEIRYREHAQDVDSTGDFRLKLIRLGARLPSSVLYRLFRWIG